MRLAVVASDQLKEEFLSKPMAACNDVVFVQGLVNIPPDADVVFDLLFVNDSERISHLRQFLPRPVFINAVITTLTVINEPFIRINAWPTFLERNLVEVVARPSQEDVVTSVFEKMEWKYCFVPDITAMISPRIIATIINEAFYTLGDGVSTKVEIDIAMKYGTNYPLGPFEWSEKIGLQNIYEILVQLSKENNLYKVATRLTNEIII